MPQYKLVLEYVADIVIAEGDEEFGLAISVETNRLLKAKNMSEAIKSGYAKSNVSKSIHVSFDPLSDDFNVIVDSEAVKNGIHAAISEYILFNYARGTETQISRQEWMQLFKGQRTQKEWLECVAYEVRPHPLTRGRDECTMLQNSNTQSRL